MRFKPSQGNTYVYWHTNANIHGPDFDPIKTNRDPNAFKYSNNIFRNDYMEWRMRAADYLYQIGSRLDRSNDGICIQFLETAIKAIASLLKGSILHFFWILDSLFNFLVGSC